MILTYQAIDANGRQTADTLEAGNPREAVEQLRQRGLYVTTIAEQRGRRKNATRARIGGSSTASPGSAATGSVGGSTATGATRIPLKILVLFTRQMAMLMRAGSGIVPAIAAIKKQMPKPAHAEILGQIIVELEDGTPLAETLRRHPRTFDPVYCAIIAAGEASASLGQMFERMALIVGQQRATRNKVLGALAYPVLLICMSSNILLSLLLFVLPRFNAMFVQLHVDPPASTKFLLATADLLVSYWPVIAGVFVLLVCTGISLFTSDRGRQWAADMQIYLPVFTDLFT